MADPQIEKLLILQHRDEAVTKIEKDLARIPVEKKQLETKIEETEATIQRARKELTDMEVRRKELDVDVKAKEAQVQRYRTQQLEVKKNEEYKALTEEIERGEKEIAELEEEEIGVMLQLDETRAIFESRKASIEELIKEHRKRIENLGDYEKNLHATLVGAKAEVEAARIGIDPLYLEHYDRVKKLVKRAPYVAPIEDHKCGGCHLRVSNEVSRGALDAGEPHFCDQCARMVYA